MKVAAWKARGKIPVSIELTAILLEAIRSDESASNKALKTYLGVKTDAELRSETEKRLLYSMALTRVVNGLVAISQQSARAKNIATICQKLGLPPNLVAVRHEAAHGEIQNLSQLRPVALQCMHWLHERYWSAQRQHFDTIASTTSDRMEKIAKNRKRISSQKSGLQKEDIDRLKKECDSIVSSLCRDLTYSQVLVCLVPKIAILIIPTKYQLYKVKAKYSEVPSRLITMWMDIIIKFTKRWDCFLPALLVSIVSELFRYCELLPRFNPSLPASSDPMQDKAYKFAISLLSCWYERLLVQFFEISISRAQVDAATDQLPHSEDEEDQPMEPQKTKPNKVKDGPQIDLKIANELLPYKSILHTCFQNLNKHSIKVIKLTVCYMAETGERDAMLPKLSTLFHFRSRALNLARAEQTLAQGGSEERVLQLQRRADSNAQEAEPKTQLSLDEFQRLLSARSTPISVQNTSQTSSEDESNNMNSSCIDRREGEAKNQISRLKENVSDSNSDKSSNGSPWILLETMSPGIGLTMDGKAPFDLSLPIELDDYRMANFLIPKHSQTGSTSHSHTNFLVPGAQAQEFSSEIVFPLFGNEDELIDSEDDLNQVERKEKHERSTESDEDAPDAKRRCLDSSAAEAEAIAAAEAEMKANLEAKKNSEKAKVKLMVGVKKTKPKK